MVSTSRFVVGVKAACALGLLLSDLALAAPWEGPRLTEEALTALETKKDLAGRTDLKPAALAAVSKYDLRMAYVEAFNGMQAEIKANAGASDGKDRPTGLTALDTIKDIDGLKNGMFTPRQNALFGLSVGLDAARWLTRDRTAEELAAAIKQGAEELKQPSLWLIRFSDAPKMEQGTSPEAAFEANEQHLSELFLKQQAFLLSLPYKCDQMYYRSTNTFGMRLVEGNHTPGIGHARAYLCGSDDLDVGKIRAKKEGTLLTVQRTAEGVWLTRVYMPRLNQNPGLLKLLEVPDNSSNTAAAVLYDRIRPLLGPDWYAIYTAPNAAQEWKVFVAKADSILEFGLPPDPSVKK